MKFSFSSRRNEDDRGAAVAGEAPAHGPSLDAALATAALADRARTTVAVASSLRLGVAGGGVEVARHVVAADGSLVMAVGEESPVVDRLAAGVQAAVPVQVRAVDVAPVALPERIRGTVLLAGRLRLLADRIPDEVREHLAGPAGEWGGRPLLHLVPRRVLARFPVPGAAETALEIDPAQWAAARTDPLVGVADEWVTHLDSGHREVLAELVGRRAGDRQVRAVAIDRTGIVLRVPDPARHVRLDFAGPVACGCDLSEAVDDLVRRFAGGATSHW